MQKETAHNASDLLPDVRLRGVSDNNTNAFQIFYSRNTQIQSPPRNTKTKPTHIDVSRRALRRTRRAAPRPAQHLRAPHHDPGYVLCPPTWACFDRVTLRRMQPVRKSTPSQVHQDHHPTRLVPPRRLVPPHASRFADPCPFETPLSSAIRAGAGDAGGADGGLVQGPRRASVWVEAQEAALPASGDPGLRVLRSPLPPRVRAPPGAGGGGGARPRGAAVVHAGRRGARRLRLPRALVQEPEPGGVAGAGGAGGGVGGNQSTSQAGGTEQTARDAGHSRRGTPLPGESTEKPRSRWFWRVRASI